MNALAIFIVGIACLTLGLLIGRSDDEYAARQLRNKRALRRELARMRSVK